MNFSQFQVSYFSKDYFSFRQLSSCRSSSTQAPCHVQTDPIHSYFKTFNFNFEKKKFNFLQPWSTVRSVVNLSTFLRAAFCKKCYRKAFSIRFFGMLLYWRKYLGFKIVIQIDFRQWSEWQYFSLTPLKVRRFHFLTLILLTTDFMA